MSILVFQIVIKQWDRSQCSPSHVAERAALPVRFPIATKPAYYVLNKPCIVDQHGDDVRTSVFKDGRIKYGMLSDGTIRFDRFLVRGSPEGDVLEYSGKGRERQILGPLSQHWVQCQYNWRYSVEEGGMRYWMYEEVILNAACMDELDDHCFLKTDPRIVLCGE